MSLYSGSYNYLGFAASDEHCTPPGIQSSEKFSVSTCSSRVNGGNARAQERKLNISSVIAWKNIIVVVEVAATCKKYKAYVYWDEDLSIGAVGKMGRDVCELLGVDTADVL
ncbi:hypothetical protein C1H46_031771 [Malus baccata]|uniref:Uncharacterized protein n=1 Tax=Malus baccata TaxID=106549 RepID=A0A540L849_MALBA|nr:hypothetical protein C1H46_031771 [Malus baccata]